MLPDWGWLRDIAWVVMVAAIVVALVTGVDYVGRALRLRRDSLGRTRAAPERESAPRAVALYVRCSLRADAAA